MSAAANTFASPAVKTPPRRVSGWAQLIRLLPYVSRHKLEVLIGMVTQIGMGIAGTLLPLILGVITDCIKGERNAAGATRAAHASFPGLPPAVLPSKRSAHAGRIRLGAGGRVRGDGIFLVLHAANPDRTVPRHRIRLAQRPAGKTGARWSRNSTSATAPAN